MNKYDKCPNCMQPIGEEESICHYCGFDIGGYEEKPNCLKPFTVLQGKYMIGRVIGVGGFGITYIGWDVNLQTYIAIKEYYPDSFASRDSVSTTIVTPHESKKEVYDKGLKRYVEEARNLSKFYQLQGIVSIKDFFYENGTGYIVMEYINGVNLKEYLNGMGGKIDESTVLALMKPVLESLYQVHNCGLVHRDISPDNIMVDNEGKIKLIDFGSVRGQSAETDKTYTVILKHGYAPPEQYYAKGKQGPWTDIYSLCATMYKMLTGQVPPNGVERMEDDTYRDPSAYGISVSNRTELVLRKGLSVKAQDRYQNIGEMLSDLYGDGALPVTGSMGQSKPGLASGTISDSAAVKSMHLDTSSGTKKKKTGLIIAIVAAAILLIIGLILIFGGKNKDKTTEASSETSETTTEATTEQATATDAPDAAYEWPTELSDTWRGYTANIDGTIYQFPLPYTEFKAKGWTTDDTLTTIAANDWGRYGFYNDRAEMTVFIANPGLKEEKVDNCYVIGFSYNNRSHSHKDDFMIELPGGIKLLSSTEADIKAAFGAPEYRYDGEYIDGSGTYVSLDYAGDTSEDGVDLEISDTENLVSISMVNTAMPEGVTSLTDLNTEAPAINSQYVAPNGESTDRFDSIITVDGKNYVLPVPFTEFEADGWTLDTSVDTYIAGNAAVSTRMEKNGESIEITLDNFTKSAIMPKYGYITKISVDSDYYSGNISFPGGIALGDDEQKFIDTYADLGDELSSDDYSFFRSYYLWHDMEEYKINISAYSDPETGLITDYSYATGKKVKE
ncbi:MAG: serine/threonine protein kinase [Wujia sp.]